MTTDNQLKMQFSPLTMTVLETALWQELPSVEGFCYSAQSVKVSCMGKKTWKDMKASTIPFTFFSCLYFLVVFPEFNPCGGCKNFRISIHITEH